MTFLEIQIDLNPNLFSVGAFTLTWHGVFSVLGILAAIRMTQWLAWRQDGIEGERIYDAAFWAVVVGLLGARIHFVIENWHLFQATPIKVFYVNEGGISQWGGIFGAMLGIWIWSYRNKVNFWKLLDAVSLPALVGLAIGRIGDVINGEHHGTATTLPWGVRYINAHTLGQPGSVVHPEVAYEMILCLGLVLILLPFYSRLKARFPDGVIGLAFLALYAVGRYFLSYLRADQVEYGLRQAQWASIVMVLLAIGFSLYLLRRRAAEAPVVEPPPSVVETQTPPAPKPSRKRAAQPTAAAPPPSSHAAGGSSGTRRPRRPKASPPGP
ncbi:MAG: prolipoprotein diacylglyceryl transferase [Candidatus Dormibacteraeota bacterium]|nr:prolipoprotein diacylglyceryl transferase [Candidatus Dormibacteraeota bacterium]